MSQSKKRKSLVLEKLVREIDKIGQYRYWFLMNTVL